MTDGIRIDLVARIDAIGARAIRLTAPELAEELDVIRRIAARHGIGAAVTVVHVLDAMLARGERGPLVQGGIGILRDAAGCHADDAGACATFAAACAVRLDG